MCLLVSLWLIGRVGYVVVVVVLFDYRLFIVYMIALGVVVYLLLLGFLIVLCMISLYITRLLLCLILLAYCFIVGYLV